MAVQDKQYVDTVKATLAKSQTLCKNMVRKNTVEGHPSCAVYDNFRRTSLVDLNWKKKNGLRGQTIT